jgi:hypothetical protein
MKNRAAAEINVKTIIFYFQKICIIQTIRIRMIIIMNHFRCTVMIVIRIYLWMQISRAVVAGDIVIRKLEDTKSILWLEYKTTKDRTWDIKIENQFLCR